MGTSKSRIAAQGQISVPADIRRSGRYSSIDIHDAIFKGKTPKPVTVEEMDKGIESYMRKKYAPR